jgi:acetyl-CoA acetyltransferase
MGLGPVPATRGLCGKLGLKPADFDLVELNEAFAAQAIAVVRELKLDIERVNVRGGAVALGHPLGCSGARILVTLIHAMRDRGAKKGLAALCVGTGMGIAMAVEAM